MNRNGSSFSDNAGQKIVALLLLFSLFWGGCGTEEKREGPPALIQVGGERMTRTRFEQSFDLALTAYPPDIGWQPVALVQARQEHLGQMVERMLILARGAELGLAVSDPELDRAVKKVLKGYSTGALDRVLLKAAIPFSAWREELKERMIMERVVEQELKGIEPAERSQAYPRWIGELRRRYPIRMDRRGVDALIRLPAPDNRKRTENGSE